MAPPLPPQDRASLWQTFGRLPATVSFQWIKVGMVAVSVIVAFGLLYRNRNAIRSRLFGSQPKKGDATEETKALEVKFEQLERTYESVCKANEKEGPKGQAAVDKAHKDLTDFADKHAEFGKRLPSRISLAGQVKDENSDKSAEKKDGYVPVIPDPLTKNEQARAVPAPLPLGKGPEAEFGELVKAYELTCIANEGGGKKGQDKVDTAYRCLTDFAGKHAEFGKKIPVYRTRVAYLAASSSAATVFSSTTPSPATTTTTPAPKTPLPFFPHLAQPAPPNAVTGSETASTSTTPSTATPAIASTSTPAPATASTGPVAASTATIEAKSNDFRVRNETKFKPGDLVNNFDAAVFFKHPNKKYAYDKAMTQKVEYQGEIAYSRWSVQDKDALPSRKIFVNNSRTIVTINKENMGFPFEGSTADAEHWTANFADEELFGYSDGYQLAQEEIIAVEHPVICGLRSQFGALDKNQTEVEEMFRFIENNEAVLLQNVPRQAKIDTAFKSNGKSIYGNVFATITPAEIDQCLTLVAPPTYSNIFSIAAPNVKRTKMGALYVKEELQHILLTLIVAFHGMKEKSLGKQVIVHNGNWGCGAFGNNPKVVYLMQLAAAHFSQVNEIRLYPREHSQAVTAAQTLFDKIKQANPDMTIHEFLAHLADNAQDYGLVWGQSNYT